MATNRDRMQQSRWTVPEGEEPVEEKMCRRCGKFKAVAAFYRRGKTSKYLAGYCKECHTKPFDTEKIVCPHCKEKIGYFGIDHKGIPVKQKSDILARLRKEVKQEGK